MLIKGLIWGKEVDVELNIFHLVCAFTAGWMKNWFLL